MPRNRANGAAQNFSGYGSRILSIAIGSQKTIFHVHEQRLRRTAFFEKHGEPPTRETNNNAAPLEFAPTTPPSEADTRSHGEIKSESPEAVLFGGQHDVAAADEKIPGVATTDTPIAEQANATHSPVDGKAPLHYHLNGGNFKDPRAFKVFVDWLYNEFPGAITNLRAIEISRRAYALALEYKAYQLQNMLVDRFRAHYAINEIRFQDLTEMINRVEVHKTAKEPVTALTAYLIEQVAHEICHRGIDDFTKDNWFFQAYLTEGDRPHRLDLFKAVVSRAVSRVKPRDPATGDYDWHVEVDGPVAGTWRNPARE